MQKTEKSQLLLFTRCRYIAHAHRRTWPIAFANNKDSYITPTFAGTEKHAVKTQENNCNTIRPLLPLKRFETGKICMFWRLPIYPDLSNQKLKFLRNRLRKQLLPTLKVFFNPQIENVLLQFAEIVDVENFYLNQTTTQLIKTFIKPNENNFAKAYVTLKNDTRPLDTSFFPSGFTPKRHQIARGISSRPERGSSTKIRGPKDSNCENFFTLLTTFVHLPRLPYKKDWFWRTQKKATKSESFCISKKKEIAKQSKGLGINFLQTSYSTNIVTFKKINTSSLVNRISPPTLYGVSQLASDLVLTRCFAQCFVRCFVPSGHPKGHPKGHSKEYSKGVQKTEGKKFFFIKDLQNKSVHSNNQRVYPELCSGLGMNEVEKKNRNWFTKMRMVNNTLFLSVPLHLVPQKSLTNVSQNFLKTCLVLQSLRKNTNLPDKKCRKIHHFFEKLFAANIETTLATTHYPFGSSYYPRVTSQAGAPDFFLTLKGRSSQQNQNLLGLPIFYTSRAPYPFFAPSMPRYPKGDAPKVQQGNAKHQHEASTGSLKRAQMKDTRTLPAHIKDIKESHNFYSPKYTYSCGRSTRLMRKNGLFRLTNKREKDSSNIEKFNPSNLSCRFSMPIRTTYWLWTRKFSRKSRWNNSSKTEIECSLLSMFNPSVTQFRRSVADHYKKPLISCKVKGFQLGNFYRTKEGSSFPSEQPQYAWVDPKLLYPITPKGYRVEDHSGYKILGGNQRLLGNKLGIMENLKIPNLAQYSLNICSSFFLSRAKQRYECMCLTTNENNNRRLPLSASVNQSFEAKETNQLAIGDHNFSKLTTRGKKNTLKLFIRKDLASNFTSTPKNLLFGNFYSKEMNDIFATNFLMYFETLEIEKKEIYWPLIMSFFPTALQRRVVKLFLSTRNWEKIRYSHIENFLEKNKKSNSV